MNKGFVKGSVLACGIYEIFLAGKNALAAAWAGERVRLAASYESGEAAVLRMSAYRGAAMFFICTLLVIMSAVGFYYLHKKTADVDAENESIGKKVFVFSVLAFQFLFLGAKSVINTIQMVWLRKNLNLETAKSVVGVLSRTMAFTMTDTIICFVLFAAAVISCVFMVGIKFEK